MDPLAIILTGIGLSMDAFAVAVSKGLSAGRVSLRQCLVTGFWFGGFQALMPFLGYFIGATFAAQIEAADHWVAFALLGFLGIRMIREGVTKGEEISASFACRPMLILALATSIDALAAGIAFSLQAGFNIWAACAIIGAITFAFSFAGLRIGSIFGAKFRGPAEIAGGVILILIGIRILAEHLAAGS